MAERGLIFKPSAAKALAKLPESVQRRIVAAIEDLAEDPHPSGCQKLKGEEDLWRIRVGDYRVIYTMEDEELIILVLRMAHRKDVYK